MTAFIGRREFIALLSGAAAGLRTLGPKIIRASKPLGSWWRVGHLI